MVLNIINLKKREDRLLSVCKQAKAQGITIKIWEGIEHKNPSTGISLAFKVVVQDAKDKELEMVAIAEDDCVFTHPDSWKYFLENIPPYFDIYLASYYSGLETFDYRIERFRGMTLFIVARKFFDKFLALPEDRDIDYALDNQGEYFVCPKFCCIQLPGYSDKDKKEVDYSNRIPHDRIFRGYPAP